MKITISAVWNFGISTLGLCCRRLEVEIMLFLGFPVIGQLNLLKRRLHLGAKELLAFINGLEA
jgi:hypothetical protein